LLLAAFLFTLSAISSAAEPTREYKIKAVFLYKFLLFTEWPKEAMEGNDRFVIGIIGRDPFGDAFEEVEGTDIGGRRLVISRFETDALTTSKDSLRNCHLLFIASTPPMKLKEILGAVSDLPIVTVSDMNGFCESGGMINFVNRKGLVRFVINKSSAERVGIRFRAKLYRVADAVIEESDEPPVVRK